MAGQKVVSKNDIGVIPVLSLEKMLRAVPASINKKAYYFNRDREGQHVFGIVGSSRMFYIPPKLYEGIGSPDETKEIEVSFILEKAGYAGQISPSEKS